VTEDPAVDEMSIDALIAMLADAAAGKRVAELVQVGVELGRRLERAGLGDVPTGRVHTPHEVPTWPEPLRVAPAVVDAAVRSVRPPDTAGMFAGKGAPPPSPSRPRRTRPIRCAACESTTLDDDRSIVHAAGCSSDGFEARIEPFGARP
jgi:hypothetical protein